MEGDPSEAAREEERGLEGERFAVVDEEASEFADAAVALQCGVGRGLVGERLFMTGILLSETAIVVVVVVDGAAAVVVVDVVDVTPGRGIFEGDEPASVVVTVSVSGSVSLRLLEGERWAGRGLEERALEGAVGLASVVAAFVERGFDDERVLEDESVVVVVVFVVNVERGLEEERAFDGDKSVVVVLFVVRGLDSERAF